MITRTSTRLADGRELIYFDETRRARDAVDTRDLPVIHVASEARFDPVLREWVVLASHRQGRTFLPPDDECPLCPSTDERSTEVPAHDYDVVVFENRFPSLATDVPDVPPLVDGEALFERRPGIGRCEVVVFSSDHAASFKDLTSQRVRTVVDVWADRTTALAAVPGVQQVFPFENRGAEIGVTLSHPHGQIYGYPFVTPRTERMLDSARAHRERTGGNLFADVLAAEVRAGVRIVRRTEHWTAFVPAAAHWPFEVHLYPNRQRAPTSRNSPTPSATTSPCSTSTCCPPRRRVRPRDALHRGVVPGAGAGRPRARLPAPAAVLDPPRARQAEVPGRVGVGDGCVRQRRLSPRRARRAVAKRAMSEAGSAGARPAASTSSVSTPTTTTASCCPSRCRWG